MASDQTVPEQVTSKADKPVKSVLFVCNQNAVRSPMAEALANKHFRRRVFVESAGLIAGHLDPFSVSVMLEEGINIENHTPTSMQGVDVSLFDLVVALTPESHEKMLKVQAENTFQLEFWPTPDPSDAEGNRNQVLESYRLVRDRLETKIADRFTF